MIWQRDKQLHFLGALVLSVGFGYFYNVAAGIIAAMLAEVVKIVMFDMPQADLHAVRMDWHEKGQDVIAQLLGALAGAAVVAWILPEVV